ncbi:ATP-binding protein [Halopenitus salinus]|uniref:histidine kinase n=1 Tax=Halopenitus salinus TaxID=1198295 RepID=A0ABD5UU91_9EURY
MDRTDAVQPLAAAVVASLGLLLASIFTFDVYQDVVIEGDRLWFTLLENSVPYLLSAAIVAIGLWLGTVSDRIRSTTVLRWIVASLAGVLILSSWVYLFQQQQGRIKPRIIAAQLSAAAILGGIVVGIYSDRQRRRREELAVEKSRLEALFENTSEPVTQVAFEGGDPVVVDVNPAFESTFGYDAREARERSFEEHGLHCYHGTTLVVDGELYGTVCFVSTDPRPDPFTPAETTFAELLARMLAREIERDHAAARIERLEEFADVLSHDLRNPLNVAQGRIDMERERADEENLRIAARSLDRIEAIISSVLAVAREGRDVEETEPVRLSALAERCFETVETSESTLHVDDDFRFHADPDRIRGVFENLFRNSIEHGSASPCSRTREDADEQRDGVIIHVGPLHDGDGFYVADDGPGIPESERETVFEAGHTTGSEGIGIGLAIVESIVEAHGWSIEIVDDADGGARFEVSGAIPAE